MYRKFIKNVLDFIFALIGIIVTLPIMLIVAFAIKAESNGPIFFIQKRTGKDGKEFDVYKFRSMSVNNDVHDFNKENEVTKVGNFIRKTSIDELPQLFNIIKGEMSFIGPRPWISDYQKYFTDEQRRRLEVKPGITGLAQAVGRNNLSILEKISYDIKYVDNLNFIMDVKVIFGTIKTVLSRNGVDISKEGIKDELQELKDHYDLYCSMKKGVTNEKKFN